MGWITDFIRFWWSLLYWNARKAWFRANPSRRRCPCQAPSDSGKALETECEASHSWALQARFRHVCPLLVSTPEGLRCSVDTANVRPFWGRAAAISLSTLLGSYLLISLLAFGTLRLVGYPVSYLTVAWPGCWHEFSQAKARYFFNTGSEAIAAGNFREGTIALNLSYQLDPSQYSTGLALARFATLLQPELCDTLFSDLMQRHPAQARSTAEHWLRSALSRGSFKVMQQLARKRLSVPGESPVPYLHALLFASRALRETDSLREFADSREGEPWGKLIATELLLRSGRRQEALAELVQTWFPKQSYFGYYQSQQLLALGRTDDAIIIAGVYQDLMPASDTVAIHLSAMAVRGDRAQLQALAENVLRQRDSLPAVVDMLATHLVRHPDRELLLTIMEQLRHTPLPKAEASERAYLAFFCAAGVQGDPSLIGEVQALIKERMGGKLLSLNAAQEFFTEKNSLLKLEAFLPVFPVSLNLIYALHERYTLMEAPAQAARPSAK